MLARRTALEEIGGFDPGFFLYCEDMDLCARLSAAGHRIRFEPAASVHHVGGHSAPRSSLLGVLVRSRVRYARKHGGRGAALLQRAGLVTEALTHLLTTLRRPAYARGHLAALRAGLSRKPA
jgi:GT2 family glycosyltransferase